MKKKRILFVAGTFSSGGAEKSMVNQMNEIDSGCFDVYAYVFKNEGLFANQVPPFVEIINPDITISALIHSPGDWRFFIKHPVLWLKKAARTSYAKLFRGKLDINQILWRLWKNDIPALDGEFDVAVGQQEGMPDYFAIDKVNAANKVLWIHSEYKKLLYDASFDAEYFAKAHAVVTISDLCRKSLESAFPALNNFEVLPNITSSALVKKMADEEVEENYFKEGLCNIISIGRLAYPKNFELAIEAAATLKAKGFPFSWIIVGEGKDRVKLQKLIDACSLGENFHLIGQRSNPYKYLKRADVAVQTSIYEGKSIFADEAKMLCKIFVSTPYDTVSDSIQDGKNGVVAADMTAEAVADAIMRAVSDSTLRDVIVGNLRASDTDITKAIERYYSVYGIFK